MKMKTRLFGLLMVVFAFTSFVFISSALAGNINIKGSGKNDAKVIIDSVEGDHPSVNFKDNATQKGVVGWYRTEDAMKFLYATTLASSNGITLKSNGNVGIGTADPKGKFQITNYYETSVPITYNNYGISNGLIIDSYQLNESGGWKRFCDFAALAHQGAVGSNIRFLTQGDSENSLSERLRIDSNGNVGIGLTNPESTLHVSDSWILGTANIPTENWKYGFHGYLTSPSGVLYEAGGAFSSHVFSAYGGGYIASFGTSSSPGNHPDTKVIIGNNGNVGIGTTDPSYKLHVNGDAAGTSWTNLSSRDYKEDIRKVDEIAHPMMLAKIMNMELTTYKYKEEYGGNGGVKLGFIAEDLPAEVLSKNGKGVDLYELLTLTIGAMKAQQKEIEEQRMENKTLKAKVSELISRIDVLEK